MRPPDQSINWLARGNSGDGRRRLKGRAPADRNVGLPSRNRHHSLLLRPGQILGWYVQPLAHTASITGCLTSTMSNV